MGIATDCQIAAPARVGRYEIVRRLGKSMTDVYLAIDTVGNRQTALKLIKSGGDMTSRLVTEAERRGAAIQRSLRELDPRVIEIYDYGDEDGYFFVAMQYVEGRNLAEVLRSERVIDGVRAATIALEICEQLAKFHTWQSAVVHGDIKPSNIHLGRNDTVRLLDFGIAKTLRPGGAATVHEFGSPGYCSPERLTRSQVDQQSDLWAVGATLYEMLAGAPPYQAENTRRLESLIRSRRAPRALPANCPKALREIVAKALAPNPERRYLTAREFQRDLQAFLEHRPTAAEIERRQLWSASHTVEMARLAWRKATRTVRRSKRALQAVGAVASFAAGMALWIGGALAYQAWQRHSAPAPAPVEARTTAAPAPKPEPLAALYRAEGERVLEAYRTSADPLLGDFDWSKAEVYLERAAALEGGDASLESELAISRGYGTLVRVASGMYTAPAATQLCLYARDQFELAAERMPADAAPHLALARMYVYWLPDPPRALAEFSAAKRLGAVLGQRELAQIQDAQRPRKERRRAAVRRPRWR